MLPLEQVSEISLLASTTDNNDLSLSLSLYHQ